MFAKWHERLKKYIIATKVLLRQVPRSPRTGYGSGLKSSRDLGITSKIGTVGHSRVLGGPGHAPPEKKIEI